MARYAAGTDVAIDKSKHQIETMLSDAGARKYAYMTEDGGFSIAFLMLDTEGRMCGYRMTVELPSRKAREFTHSPTGKLRSQEVARKEWDQACKSTYRSLWLIVKAKLEAVRSGISTIEREFMADRLMPDGRTLEHVVAEQAPQLDAGAPLMLEHKR